MGNIKNFIYNTLKKHYSRDNDMDLIERNKYWKNKMDEKIQTQRKSMEGRDLEFCTFKPNISKVFFFYIIKFINKKSK